MNPAATIRVLTEGGAVTAALETEHEAIDGALQAFARAIRAGASGDTIKQLLQVVVEFCEQHFAHEESVLREHGSPTLAGHKAIHEQILAKLHEILSRSNTDETSLAVLDAADLLHDLHHHIASCDQAAYNDIETRLASLLKTISEEPAGPSEQS